MLAVLAQIAAVGVDHGGRVVINAWHLLFVHRNHHHHAMLGRNFLHQTDGRAVGDALGQFVPPGILLRTKIGAVKKLLQAENLRLLAGGLIDQFQVLVDHRLSDLRERAFGGKRVAGLNQGTANIAGHETLQS